jgi:hypothetical protein
VLSDRPGPQQVTPPTEEATAPQHCGRELGPIAMCRVPGWDKPSDWE